MTANLIGICGENLVKEWLINQGYAVLNQRWRSPYGEIDLIVKSADWLLFIEVKTRKTNNIDENGLLQINQRKQTKIINTANYYLYTYPELANLHCRFDIAIVTYPTSPQNPLYSLKVKGNKTFYLHSYLTGSFTLT